LHWIEAPTRAGHTCRTACRHGHALQDELALRFEELQEQINTDSTAEPVESQIAAAVTPEDRKGGGNPIKHIIKGRWLAGLVY